MKRSRQNNFANLSLPSIMIFPFYFSLLSFLIIIVVIFSVQMKAKYFFGAVGQGSRVKLIVNMIMGAIMFCKLF